MFIDQNEVVRLLKKRTQGKQANLALEVGMSAPFISRVLRGSDPPSKRLLDLIGYERVIMYRKKA